MMGKRKKSYSCGLDAALAIIGGKWKFFILWAVSDGPKRFGELRRKVAGISEKMLIQELKEMEQDGLVLRKDYKEVPPRVDYTLSPFGAELFEAVEPLSAWGARHIERIGGLPSQADGKRSCLRNTAVL